jgi:hypothetical protein
VNIFQNSVPASLFHFDFVAALEYELEFGKLAINGGEDAAKIACSYSYCLPSVFTMNCLPRPLPFNISLP